MSYSLENKIIDSSDGIHKLNIRIYIPDSKPKGLFHVVHGMTEHIDRYAYFMSQMAEAGYICFGYNNLGHGDTALNDSELGFIASEKGYALLALDVSSAARFMKEEYGDLPYILMGHSMGSFIVRVAAKEYITPDKLIIMGTGGPNSAAGMGLKILKVIKKLKGERHISKLSYALAFGSYNRRFGDDDPNNWLTNDAEIRRKYAEDKFCTFKFTVSAMIDLITLNVLANTNEWFSDFAGLPILLVSGEYDPVGDDGKGVKVVYDKLKENGAAVQMILYENARHEILNDFCKEQVTQDIIEFIEEKTI